MFLAVISCIALYFYTQNLLQREIEEEQQKNSNSIMMYREHMPEIHWLMKKSKYSSNIFNFFLNI